MKAKAPDEAILSMIDTIDLFDDKIAFIKRKIFN